LHTLHEKSWRFTKKNDWKVPEQGREGSEVEKRTNQEDLAGFPPFFILGS
jgi:hypothetical protein